MSDFQYEVLELVSLANDQQMREYVRCSVQVGTIV